MIERLNIKSGITERRGITDDFFDNVGKRDDPLGPAKFVHHDGQPLCGSAQQIHRIVSGTNDGLSSVSVYARPGSAKMILRR